jgi:hypothetical protein
MNQCPIKLPNFNKKYLFVIKRLTKNCDRGHFKSQHAWRHIDIINNNDMNSKPAVRACQQTETHAVHG